MSATRKKKEIAKKGKVEVKTPTAIAKFSPVLQWVVFVVFVLLSAFGMYNHEPWKDELQAWVIARDSNSIGSLLHNLQFDGHPALWHFVLMLTSKVFDNPAAMQWVHFISACAVAYIIIFKSPFSMFQKAAIVFGYFFLFEYNVISRDYSFGIFFYLLILLEMQNIRSSYWRIAIYFILACNSNLYAGLLAAILFGVLMLSWVTGRMKKQEISLSKISIIAAGVLIGITTLYLQIKPGPHNRNYLRYPEGFEFDRLKFTMVNFTKVFIPIPDMSLVAWWNTNPLIKDPVVISNVQFFCAVLIFLLLLLLFLKRPFSFLFFIISAFLVCLFTYITFVPYIRYIGHIYIALLGAFWIDKILIDQPRLKFAEGISTFFYRYRFVVLNLVLVIQLVAGGMAYYGNAIGKFSRIKDAADYIKANNYDKNMIFGFTDFGTTGLCAYIDKPLFLVQRDTFGRFILWDDKRNHFMDIKTAIDSTLSKIKNKKGEYLFASSSQLMQTKNGIKAPLESISLGENARLKLVNQFEGSITGDDNFYLYLISK
jgi:hypothetical protein